MGLQQHWKACRLTGIALPFITSHGIARLSANTSPLDTHRSTRLPLGRMVRKHPPSLTCASKMSVLAPPIVLITNVMRPTSEIRAISSSLTLTLSLASPYTEKPSLRGLLRRCRPIAVSFLDCRPATARSMLRPPSPNACLLFQPGISKRAFQQWWHIIQSLLVAVAGSPRLMPSRRAVGECHRKTTTRHTMAGSYS